MRPVRLELDGFASFRAPNVIDFTGADYFALVGATGAGKSTVIDAMVFALYGSAPRWDRSNAVQYALAPTATRATVRLVFDVGNQRYQVAREVRRSGKSGPQQKSASLERFDDPTATSATTDEVTVLASEVRELTGAVERLLGLSFEDFTKAVVLPQGRFAEFLSTTPAKRQDILLKLLGADQYDLVMKAAGQRRSAAELELVGAQAKIEGLDGATAQAEEQAEAELEQWRAATELLGALSSEVDTAEQVARSAADDLTRAVADRDALAAVTIPDEVHDLADRVGQAREHTRSMRARTQAAEQAHAEAREQLEQAGSRSELERIRDRWVELAELDAQRPALDERAAADAVATELAARAREQAQIDWTQAHGAEAMAAAALRTADQALDELTERRALLDATAPPAGLVDLTGRLSASTELLHQASSALAAAEQNEDRARLALHELGDPADLAARLTRLEAALALTAKQAALHADRDQAEHQVRVATADRDQAAEQLGQARSEAQSARDRATAATLRGRLAVGETCPVCEQQVLTLPEPSAADHSDTEHADADHTEAGLAAAEQAADLASAQLTRAQTLAERLARDLTQAAAELQLLNPDGSDLTEQHAAALSARTALREAEQALATAVTARGQARGTLDRARSADQQLDAERKAALADLHSAQAALSALGAPPAHYDSPHQGWAALLDWRSARLDELDQTLLGQASAQLADSRAAHQLATDELTRAAAFRDRAQQDEREAAGQAARSLAARDQASERSALLGAQLDGGPDATSVLAALEHLGVVEQAEQAALVAVQRARAERDRAEQAEAAVGAELGTAQTMLRATRDGLAPLGAPVVDESDLATAWAALAAWAAQASGAAERAVLTAHQASRDATAAVEHARGRLAETASAAGLPASGAQPAVAAAQQVALAQNRLDRLRTDRERLGELLTERDQAAERGTVAGMLADQLSARKFQRWLAGAALDLLVDAASDSLLELSGGQFGLTHDQGEFFVIDHADAEAQRSVRTLSGGETFQASLALALALSAELSSLSSSAARLDSIFLDEGFGSLDPDSLEVVAATLERLAAGDRMVGVVTHVQGLAERIPTRFQVTRDSRSSHVSRVG